MGEEDGRQVMKSNIIRIEIDQDLCNGCKMCNKVCYEDVFRWDEVTEKPVAAYPEDCVACLTCEGACTAQCIEVIPRYPVSLPDPY